MKDRFFGVVVVLTSLLVLSGCTEEKAKAIKAGASQFNNEAQTALDMVETMLIENMAMPPVSVDRIVQDLEDTRHDFDYEVLYALIEERDVGKPQEALTKNAVAGVRSHYIEFASIFRSLDKGRLLAGDAVKKAEIHCMNLSMQLITLADYISEGKIESRLNSERILLYENIRKAQAIEDSLVRKTHLTDAAKSIVQLHIRETEIEEAAILQLLKAAQMGRATAQLIHDYEELSVSEILTLVEETLYFASSVSEKNKDVDRLLEEYKEVETMVRRDEYWGPLLEKRIRLE